MHKTRYISILAPVAVTVLTSIALAFGDNGSRWAAEFPDHIFSYRASCANNLKQIGLAMKIYAAHNSGDFPRISTEPGRVMVRSSDLYPDYLLHTEIFVCPGKDEPAQEDPFDDRDYIYWGYLLTNDEDAELFVDAYAAEVDSGGDFTTHLNSPSSYDDSFYILTQDVHLLYNSSSGAGDPISLAQIPILIEWPDNHQPGWGGNVLYLDGHAEWVPLGQFPMTEIMIGSMAKIAGFQPPTAYAEPHPAYTPESDPNGYNDRCSLQVKLTALEILIYSLENSGRFPKLSPNAGTLMMRPDGFYPDYLSNPEWLNCPGTVVESVPALLDDHHYAYLGYLLTNDADAEAFVQANADEIASGGDFSGLLAGPSTYGDFFYPLADNVERFLITDLSLPPPMTDADIPTFVEWPGNHQGQMGGHVLYLDGHVEWLPYPSEFPMTEATIGALAEIAEWTPATEWVPPNPAYTPENDAYRFNADCAAQVKSLARSKRHHAAEHGGSYPDMSAVFGQLMYGANTMFPSYILNPYNLVCPGTTLDVPDYWFNDDHYVYTGYILLTDADAEAFAANYADHLATYGHFLEHMGVPSSYGDTILRLNESYSRSYFTTNQGEPDEDIISTDEIPVMIEWPGNHAGLLGGHVSYLDGHVEWLPYPGEFPMTEATIAALASVAGWTPVTEWRTADFTPEDDPDLQALCQHNLAMLQSSLHTNSLDDGKVSDPRSYADLSQDAGKLMFVVDQMVPYYLHDTIRLNCPGSRFADEPPAVDDQSYVYLGYAIRDEAELGLFEIAYNQRIDVDGDFSGDLSVGDASIYHLSQWLKTSDHSPFEWSLDGPLPRDIPVLIEWPDNHTGLRGGNVLFFDGHVEWIDYPGRFPMTEYTMSILTELAGRSPIRSVKSEEEVAQAVTARDAFAELDADGDGLLTLTESGFDAGTFAVLDLNNDGSVSIPELLETSVGPTGQAPAVYVDFDHTLIESGTESEPFNSVVEAANFVATGGAVRIAPGSSPETVDIFGAMSLERNAEAGEVVIGAP